MSGYAAAASLLLAAAAALRFDDLSSYSLGWDEAVLAVRTQGSLGELFEVLRHHTAPILYPLLLWVVQKIEVSNFAVRFLPAAAGVLTVGALLFLLPRAGAPRRAAFFAGALAAVSGAALTEAHGAREYSLDALFAALLIVGLLRFLRDGRGLVLLGSGLFLGPLVQYGLVLFGAAVLATAFVLCRPRGASPRNREESRSRKERNPEERSAPARAGLIEPAVLFAAAGVVALGTTLFRQLRWHLPRTSANRSLVLDHLQEGYYGGGATDLLSLLGFVFSSTRDLLRDQLVEPFPAVILFGSGGLLLVVRVARRQWPRRFRKGEPEPGSPLAVVLTLCLFSLGFAAIAAVAGIYPIGAGRQATYLGPVIFTTAGFVLAAALESPAAVFRRWPTTALSVAAVSGIAWAGGREVSERTGTPSATGTGEEVGRVLTAETRPDDLIYLFGGAIPIVDFYLRRAPAAEVARRDVGCYLDLTCTEELAAALRMRPEPPERLWIAAKRLSGPWLRESLRAWSADLRLHPVVVADGVRWEQHGGDIRLYRLEGLAAAVEERFPTARSGETGESATEAGVPDWEEVDWGEPTDRSHFAVWRREDAIAYRRSPCSAADTEARFFLELERSPEARRAEETVHRYLDFEFEEHGVREDRRCLAIVPIPEAGYSKFETGQSGGTTSWRAAGRLDEERYRAALRSAASGEWGPPLRRAGFDLWLDGTELRYLKEPCARAEAEPRFFLHLQGIVDSGGGPRRLNRDFDFPEYGVVSEGKCLALVPLPGESRFTRIATGQWRPGEPPFWRTDLWFPPRRPAHESLLSGAWGEPAARSAFDLYLRDDGLWYHRSPCSADDLEARFFLHLYPHDPADLPTAQTGRSFENRDFAFSEYGAPLDDACLARLPLPEYPLARLRTGQFVSGSDPLWTADLAVPAPPPDE